MSEDSTLTVERQKPGGARVDHSAGWRDSIGFVSIWAMRSRSVLFPRARARPFDSPISNMTQDEGERWGRIIRFVPPVSSHRLLTLLCLLGGLARLEGRQLLFGLHVADLIAEAGEPRVE